MEYRSYVYLWFIIFSLLIWFIKLHDFCAAILAIFQQQHSVYLPLEENQQLWNNDKWKRHDHTFVYDFLPSDNKLGNADFFASCYSICDVPKNREQYFSILYTLTLSVLSQSTLAFIQVSKAIARGVLYKKMFLKLSQNLQENTCIEPLL